MKRSFPAVVCCVASLASCFAAELRVERRKPLTANVGVVSAWLDAYWKRCPGLFDDMVKLGADAYWKFRAPDEWEKSPCGSVLPNSFCRAFGSALGYFLRKEAQTAEWT